MLKKDVHFNDMAYIKAKGNTRERKRKKRVSTNVIRKIIILYILEKHAELFLNLVKCHAIT